MEFNLGTSVYTVDGKEAGSLNRVVIQPETKEITHLVIQKGLLVPDEKVISAEKILSAAHERISLTCTSDDIKEMSPLDIKQYQSPGETPNFDRMGAGTYTAPNVSPHVLTELVRTIPDDLVALKDKAHVMSSDDKQVGNIQQVFSETGKITHFIASHGLLLKSRRAIPIEWVQMLTDDEIRLSVAASQVEDLPGESE